MFPDSPLTQKWILQRWRCSYLNLWLAQSPSLHMASLRGASSCAWLFLYTGAHYPLRQLLVLGSVYATRSCLKPSWLMPPWKLSDYQFDSVLGSHTKYLPLPENSPFMYLQSATKCLRLCGDKSQQSWHSRWGPSDPQLLVSMALWICLPYCVRGDQ